MNPAADASPSVLVRHLPELVLASAATTLIVLEVWLFEPGGPMVARTIAGVTAGGVLAFVRRRPFEAYLVNGFAIYALIGLGFPSDFYQWTNLIALIGSASRVNARKAVLILALAWIGVLFYFWRFPGEGGWILAGAVVAIWTAGWFAGRTQFVRNREIEIIRERDLGRAELAAQQAITDLTEERSRIARDLHDIIGHAVNVMVVHAGAGRGMVADHPEARAAFDTIAVTGRSALADLDRMLNLLQGRSVRSPLPGLDELAELCSAVASPQLKVELEITGDRDRVSSSLGVAVFRLVQEALTNVIKHAGATRAEVTVTIGDRLAVVVSDDGSGGPASAGRGLKGIKERVELHGGEVSYGPGATEGFELRAELPLETMTSTPPRRSSP